MSESTAMNAGTRLTDLPPLGWAAKRLEDGLSEFVDTLFAGEFGLTRRHWQLLRWVAERADPRVEAFVAEAAAFYTDVDARQVIDDLLDRRWVDHLRPEESDPQLSLTAEARPGRSGQRTIRARLMSSPQPDASTAASISLTRTPTQIAVGPHVEVRRGASAWSWTRR